MKKDEILRALRGADGYVSGQELCGRFGVSRTAVWKAVRQLREDGYAIEAQTNRGYRLVDDGGADAFCKVEIESYMDTGCMGRKVFFYEETASTNAAAKELADKGEPSGTLVAADMQTAGRGRRGREWASPKGKNIYMTLLLRPECTPDKASALTLVMALAVAEAVGEILPDRCKIKWPNDIVIDGKKICGILTEMSAEPDDIHYVVTGVGINVNQTSFPEELEGSATSLRLVSGRRISRARLAARVMHHFEAYHALFAEDGDLTRLIERYDALLVNRDREVRVLDPKGAYEGVARGINEKGELIVERACDGQTVLVYAGEVSVRGIYGYAV